MMKATVRVVTLLLTLTLCPLSLAAQPLVVDITAEPWASINTRLTVFVALGKPGGEFTVKLLRIDGEQISVVRELRTVDAVSRAGVATRGSLPDRDMASASLELEMLLFLPLGRYQVEISDGEITTASNVEDTGLFLRLLAQRELFRQRNDDAVFEGIRHGDEPEATRGKITPLAPKGTTSGTADLRFRWRSSVTNPDVKYTLYLFDQSGEVWRRTTRDNEVSYDGPSLEPGRTLFWVVGAGVGDGVLRFESVASFQQ